MKVHAIKRWLSESIETPAGFLVTRHSGVAWACSVGRLPWQSSLLHCAPCCSRVGGRLWKPCSALSWVMSCCWPPALGWLKPEEKVWWLSEGSRGGEAYFYLLQVVCRWYLSQLCIPSAAFLALSELWVAPWLVSASGRIASQHTQLLLAHLLAWKWTPMCLTLCCDWTSQRLVREPDFVEKITAWLLL